MPDCQTKFLKPSGYCTVINCAFILHLKLNYIVYDLKLVLMNVQSETNHMSAHQLP